ncbi:Cd2+/Zn2+-exporting ATPase [Cerasibacillus quisquiliarum]|uniref:Cd(2+)-exporting ATPase n=1 Tax=Cerasibacillus quisquiliarum TaxID=227865 RepID=A0A511V286_9BACI|nr:cation-translocating P-type ATPase [Cerasibacillus quisquiliarum]MBB5147280.1 Cd2+/Zn2+-exporting ATPase [Cerasibacillus quisquiliarum]GEN32151.1 haloacid dehalogenase [Cerasibacillus quisquiliarum]
MQLFINRYKNQITLISFILIVSAFLIGGDFKNIALILATVVAGVPIALKAYQALKMKAFSIELLVTIAVIGALFIQEFVESAVVTFLFMFGDYLEGRTLEKTRSSLKELVDMAPQEATVIRNGVHETIPAEEVNQGERLIVHAGGKIPVDGEIIAGEASINEAAITGESIPVRKKMKDAVFSGTIVDSGYVELIAEKVGDDTTFAKIIELVEEAQESKSKTEKFLNKFAAIYTPGVVGLSLLVYLLTRDLHIAITFLVIACPGALVIGAPVSNVVGIGNGAKHGILIKGGEAMDNFSKVDTVVFDKTGTLTKGKPEVTDYHVFGTEDPEELFKDIARAELISEHHLGRTIVQAAKKRGLDISGDVDEGEVIKGNGIRATVDGRLFVIGNRKLMEKENIAITQEIENVAVDREKQGNTAIFVAVEGEIKAIISIADEIRDDAKEAISEMRQNGVKKIMMLTGDNEYTARLVAEKLGLDAYDAELLPEDKVEYVKRLKDEGHVVAMAGDGVNDAPAIATADIGVAMGEGGTDISMETADVVLMADQLKQFSHAFSLSKASMRNMKQNIWIAVGTVVLLLIGVLNGTVHLASGMFIHEASVLVVILNGMRLMAFKRDKKKLKNSGTLETDEVVL